MPVEEAARLKEGSSKLRWERAMAQKPFDTIRNLPIIDTRAEHFIQGRGAVFASVLSQLRREHGGRDCDRQWPSAQCIRDRASLCSTVNLPDNKGRLRASGCGLETPGPTGLPISPEDWSGSGARFRGWIPPVVWTGRP